MHDSKGVGIGLHNISGLFYWLPGVFLMTYKRIHDLLKVRPCRSLSHAAPFFDDVE
jgi:hypothetical protein